MATLGRCHIPPLFFACKKGKANCTPWRKEATRQTDPASPEFVKRGGDRKSEGIKVSNTDFDRKSSPKERNSKPGTLRRLARSRPDLLARVESGELSAHAAAVQAGIRKPMKSIPVDTPPEALQAPWAHRPGWQY